MIIVNPNLQFIRDHVSHKRVISLRGGTRSGKSYSAVQYLIELCYTYPNAGMTISVVRQALTTLRRSTFRDFKEILESFNAWDDACMNWTNLEYSLNGNKIEFFSLDDAQKLRGAKRDFLFMDEANEATAEAFRQLSYRTTGPIVLAYNPSMVTSWVYDVEAREDSCLLVTTYKDNPFLSKNIVAEIESLRHTSPEDFAVYGEGKRGSGRKGRIFHNVKEVEHIDWDQFPEVVYGLDFGYSQDPLAVVRAGVYQGELYVEELIYEAGIGNTELVNRLRDIVGAEVIICDNDKRGILALREGGIRAVAANKPAGSILAGIRQVQSFPRVNVLRTSRNLVEEFAMYSWKMDPKTEMATDKPEDKHNHAIDALRYAISGKRRESIFL